MDKFEYKTIVKELSIGSLSEKSLLHIYGYDGWELVSVFNLRTQIAYYFKRKLPKINKLGKCKT